MSDLLDVSPTRPHRRRRRRGRGAALAKLLGVLLGIVVLLGAAGYAGVRLIDRSPDAPDYSGSGTGKVVVQVAKGASLSQVGVVLKDKGVVRSTAAFRQATLKQPDATKLQPGYYQLRSQMSAASALALLLDPSSRLRGRVTLPEGVPLAQALETIAKGASLKVEDLRAAVADPSALGLPAYAKGKVEGFLYPATYDVEPGTTAQELLKVMVARYNQEAEDLDLATRAAAIGRTPYEVITTASLIEKETAFPADRNKVARVVYNRLEAGMPLQFDSTVNYIRTEKKARLTLADIDVESAYNTYQNKGLPPTPIDSPGQASIEAALQPASGDYVYFVTVSKSGQSLFTADYDEFLRAKAKAKAEGVY